MKAFFDKHKKTLLWGPLILLALWAIWYARPVDIYFLLGDSSPNWTSGLVRDVTSVYGRQSRNLDPGDDSEAAALTAEVLAELEGLRFHRSPLEPLLRILPPMGGGSIRYGEDGKKEYDIYLFFYDIRSEEDWDTLLFLRFWIDRWSYGPYGNLPLYVSHGHEAGRELGAALWESPFASDSKS